LKVIYSARAAHACSIHAPGSIRGKFAHAQGVVNESMAMLLPVALFVQCNIDENSTINWKRQAPQSTEGVSAWT
jgi:hypothetical protein